MEPLLKTRSKAVTGPEMDCHLLDSQATATERNGPQSVVQPFSPVEDGHSDTIQLHND